ncbi:MAG: histidinol dehydrogenase [Candidatus Hydrogenedentes bacterium]|nr:histidinol dehydrogenase [Candidatus Hydrogenedentota bacterium]
MKHIDISNDTVRKELDEFILGLSDAANADRSIQEKLEQARWIVEAVRKNGDAAVAEFTERFDGVALTPDRFEVSPKEMDKALAGVDKNLVRILERAHENIRRFHSKHLRESWEETLDDGTVLGQRVTPVESAGVYVPGGKAFYPSTALMNITPARVAGVKEIIMVSPPTFNGDIHPVALAAARIAGASRVFRIGGAQAIAALAYGTATIPAVTKITGPGNTYVTAAKAIVRGRVEIDSEAGPSEVLVLADEKANPAHVAAELLAQAEHDEEAMCLLVTPSAELIAAVQARIAAELPNLPRRDIIKKSLDNRGMLIRTRNMDEAVAITNLYAPEHLSIQADFPRKLLEKIHNAGAIMVGANTPVAVGDYYAGPNHTLPTGRKARFSSPLTAEDFRKVTSVLYYTSERLQREANDIMTFANTEELQAHARSIEVRL